MELKSQCRQEMNQEYLYLCDILIIDIYINENLWDDALNTAVKALEISTTSSFRRYTSHFWTGSSIFSSTSAITKAPIATRS